MRQRLVTWNVNGLRSVATKGFLKYLYEEDPDVLCLQEIKAEAGDLDESLRVPHGYHSFFFSAQKKGYSGVAVYSKSEPRDVLMGLGDAAFDSEGRVISVDLGHFILINAYFPNSQRDHSRLGYKLDFCKAMREFCDGFRRQRKEVILCGDFNIAHQEIDLKNPQSNRQNAGFLPEERQWMSEFLGAGYVDIFRRRCPDPGYYSWWSYRPGVREKDIGWRLDYHVITPGLESRVIDSSIQKNVMGSDHCPVSLTLGPS